MERLGEVVVDNTLQVKMSCEVDQTVISRNFAVILDCLKQLQHQQSQHSQGIKNSLNGKTELDAILKRLDQHDADMLESIKETNLLLKDMKDVKHDIEELKIGKNSNAVSLSPAPAHGLSEAKFGEIINNINTELNKQHDKTIQLENGLKKWEKIIQDLEKELKVLKEVNSKEGESKQKNATDDESLNSIKSELQDKIDVLRQKLNNINQEVNQHDLDIRTIKETMQADGQEISTDQLHKLIHESKDQNELYHEQHKKEISLLNEELNRLKNQLRNMKSSINENVKSQDIRGSRTKIGLDSDTLERLNDLNMRVSLLEKTMSSKMSFENVSNPQKVDKLPLIKKARAKGDGQTNTAYPSSAGFSKKDIHELKGDLQIWLKNYLNGEKDKESMDGFDLKLQQIRRGLDRKADGEGTKKGLTFLENKITQLYLFLTEPETDDAMIVRRGFNCLSCSKKVQKLRGKLGPRMNWNNMTSTNYSPPRVGYSKPAGEHEDEA